MREIEFKVKFITPLLIGGSQKNDIYGTPRWNLDEEGLTGKALRGCWRFWFRAIIGGMIEDIKAEELRQLESSIFGSAGDNDINNEKIGATFRIVINTESEFRNNELKLGFNKPCSKCKGKGCPNCKFTGKLKSPATSQGYLENSSYTIKVAPRNTMFDTELNVLLATIWGWGNLGAIGKRSRRGFGSSVICLSSKTEKCFKLDITENESLSLPIIEKFEDREALNSYLKEGLYKIWLIYKTWIENDIINNSGILSNKKILDISAFDTPPVYAPYFILRNFRQISVGNKGYIKIDDAITAVHGKRDCYGMGWAGKPNSRASERMASPLFIRFHQVAGVRENEIFPVVTWCKQKYVRDHVKDKSEYIDCIMEFLSSIHTINNLCGGSYE